MLSFCRLALVLTVLLGFGCKANLNQGKVASLDNFTRGEGALRINSCEGDNPVIENKSSTDDPLIIFPDLPSDDPIRIKLTKAVMTSLSAVPYSVQTLFFKSGGRIVITRHASQICSRTLEGSHLQFAREISSAAKGNVEPYIHGCWNIPLGPLAVVKNQRLPVEADPSRPLIYLPPDAKSINHALVRIMGFTLSQIYPRLGSASNFVSKTRQEPADITALRSKLVKSLIDDVKANKFSLKAYEHLYSETSPNSVQPGKKSGVDSRRLFEDFVFAESFDSFYCSVDTRKKMDNSFKRTFGNFQEVDGILQELTEEIRRIEGKTSKKQPTKVKSTNKKSLSSDGASLALNGGGDLLSQLVGLLNSWLTGAGGAGGAAGTGGFRDERGGGGRLDPNFSDSACGSGGQVIADGGLENNMSGPSFDSGSHSSVDTGTSSSVDMSPGVPDASQPSTNPISNDPSNISPGSSGASNVASGINQPFPNIRSSGGSGGIVGLDKDKLFVASNGKSSIYSLEGFPSTISKGMLVYLHGDGGRDYDSYFPLISRVAAQHNMMPVAVKSPTSNANGPTWWDENANPSDYGGAHVVFLEEVLQQILKSYNIDRQNIVFTGASGGPTFLAGPWIRSKGASFPGGAILFCGGLLNTNRQLVGPKDWPTNYPIFFHVTTADFLLPGAKEAANWHQSSGFKVSSNFQEPGTHCSMANRLDGLLNEYLTKIKASRR